MPLHLILLTFHLSHILLPIIPTLGLSFILASSAMATPASIPTTPVEEHPPDNVLTDRPTNAPSLAALNTALPPLRTIPPQPVTPDSDNPPQCHPSGSPLSPSPQAPTPLALDHFPSYPASPGVGGWFSRLFTRRNTAKELEDFKLRHAIARSGAGTQTSVATACMDSPVEDRRRRALTEGWVAAGGERHVRFREGGDYFAIPPRGADEGAGGMEVREVMFDAAEEPEGMRELVQERPQVYVPTGYPRAGDEEGRDSCASGSVSPDVLERAEHPAEQKLEALAQLKKEQEPEKRDPELGELMFFMMAVPFLALASTAAAGDGMRYAVLVAADGKGGEVFPRREPGLRRKGSRRSRRNGKA